MTEQEIHNICKRYEIENYTINSDGSIDVRGNVNLSYNKLRELPLNFNIVHGHFYCDNNKLTSLNKFPKFVGGDCNVSYNNLTSLEGCPKEVGETFYCSSNKLTSLQYSPEIVYGRFYCGDNPLESLDGYNSTYKQLICQDKLKLIRKTKLKILNIL